MLEYKIKIGCLTLYMQAIGAAVDWVMRFLAVGLAALRTVLALGQLVTAVDRAA